MYLSNYVILGRNKKNEYILIHTYMGNVDILEEEYGDVLLKSREKNIKINSESIPKEIYDELVKKFYLVSSKDEDRERYIKVADTIKRVNQNRKVSYTLIPSYECNFRCSYCFELDVVGKKDNNKKMSKELVDIIFSDIDKNIVKKKDISILLFGGEPLLNKNKDINSYIAENALKRNIKLSAISNGYELMDYEDLFKKGCFKSIQVTLDGDEEVHDSRRYRIGKKPTFKQIVDNVDKVLNIDNGPMISIRINIDKNNYDSVQNLYEIFKEKQWLSNNKFKFYTKSVHACYAKPEERIYDSDVIENVKLFDDSLKNMCCNVTYRRILSSINSIFNQDRKIGNLKTGACSAVNDMKVIDAYGDIYACYEKVNSKEDRIGYVDIDLKQLIYNDKKDLWQNRHVQNLNKCIDCCYSLICGGNCPEHGEVTTGDLYKPCCEDFKKVFNEALLELAPVMDEK